MIVGYVVSAVGGSAPVVRPALGLIHCLEGNKCEDRRASDDQEEANIG